MKVRLEFKPQDAWIGVFWKKKIRKDVKRGDRWYYDNYNEYHLWVCIIPCLPIHIQWDRGRKK